MRTSRIPDLPSLITLLTLLLPCSNVVLQAQNYSWEKHGPLTVNENSRIISHQDGTPFLWLGCTAWGMTEHLTREEVDFYLDNRKSKGMNVVQLCLFWGKREDYPTKFTVNAANPYGHKAFPEKNGTPVMSTPAVRAGGSLDNPNDYWDHVDYCLDAVRERNMYAAVIPIWGRRYVNGVHKGYSVKLFNQDNIRPYGEFLGKRYGDMPNIIWVNGGDAKADEGGDCRSEYRILAEGLIKGATGRDIDWNAASPAWNELFITYHPDGSPMKNSSTWFHNDPWLDFNMIETNVNRHMVAAAIRQDYNLQPVKPTVLGEGHYEGMYQDSITTPLHVRRQAWQTFFTGGAGFTYGGFFGEDGSGPLFSPANNWKPLLNMEGAAQLIHLKTFLEKNNWWDWQPNPEIITEGRGEGEVEKLAVKSGNAILVYFPDSSGCRLSAGEVTKATWYSTENGTSIEGQVSESGRYIPPPEWEDAVLILEY